MMPSLPGPRLATGLAALGAAIAILFSGGCGGNGPAPSTEARPEPELKPTPGFPWFVDVTRAAGVDFQHYDSATAMHYVPEVMGSGIGWIDYDADGWPDLFCVQDCPVLLGQRAAATETHKLFHNNQDGAFTDVTREVGLNRIGYGMGCAVGDFNNDGFDDLVVTYLDGVSLFENRSDGKGGRRFEDVTARSGINNPHWGTSCGWGDIDNDGFLDLYICNYVQIDLAHYKICENSDVHQVYVCPPTVFPFVSHKLYRNNGNGSFTDITASSGIGGAAAGAGLGVLLNDFDGDGRIDIYVAIDMRPAHLFQNLGNAKFREVGLASGAALMPQGRFMAGMGVASGAIDRSGHPSLLVSNYQDEATMVFRNRGKMTFQEWSHASGLGPATKKTLGFGIELFDADLDGHLDVGIVNGHVVRNSQAIFKAPYAQSAQFFLGTGDGHFDEVSETSGAYFREKRVGRGLAVADYDNDGRPDFAASHNAGPARLLHNETATSRHWVRLELVGDGKKSNRNAIGSKIEIETGNSKLVRWIHGGGSYLSASDRRLVVGLKDATTIEKATVHWPSGNVQEFRNLAVDRGWKLTEGKPDPSPLPPARLK